MQNYQITPTAQSTKNRKSQRMGVRYVEQKQEAFNNISSLNSPKAAKDHDIKMRMRAGHGTQAAIQPPVASSLVE